MINLGKHDEYCSNLKLQLRLFENVDVTKLVTGNNNKCEKNKS